MKYFFTLMMTLILNIAAFGQAEKIVVKSIPIENATVATLELPGEVSTKEWDKEYLRINTTITVTNTNEQILNRLVTVGRYEFQVVEQNGEILIQMPKMIHHIAVGGEDLNELLQFEVLIPKNFQIKKVYPAYYQPNPMM